MTQNIRDALAQIVAIETALTVTAPTGAPSIKRVYTYVPPKSETPKTPCWIHSVTLGPVDHFAGSREMLYIVRSQFLSGEPNEDRASDVAAAYLGAWLDAISNNQTLNGTVSGPIRVRGLDPTITRLEYAGAAYIGLDLVIEIPMGPEAVTVGP